MQPADRQVDAHAAILAAARQGEFDRYASALLAPSAVRNDIIALAAFAAELARIAPLTRREPAMGEIRLQWWRDALAGSESARTGNPIADAVTAAARRHQWPLESLLGIVDAHAHDGLADPFSDDAELLSTLALGEGALFTLTARTLGAEPDTVVSFAGSAGTAYGIARHLLGLPQSLARKHVPVPQSRLSAAGVSLEALLAGEDTPAVRNLLAAMGALARNELAVALQGVAELPRGIRVAFLPLALVRHYLRVTEVPGRHPLRDSAEVSPLRRMLRIGGMHMFGRA